jgi:AcrR family transcriptional regulator
VRDAILDATVALAAHHGLLSVNMSQVAAKAGISRATLYKYFPDVESILLAQHDRQVAGELEQLHAIRDAGGDPGHQLVQVLRIHATTVQRHHGSAIAPAAHRTGAHQHQEEFLQDILRQAADSGAIRSDIPPVELTRFCLHALSAAAQAASSAAVERLVQLTIDSLKASTTCSSWARSNH